MNNEKKMPQDGTQSSKPGARPDPDQKKPQSNDRELGQERGVDDKEKKAPVKPDMNKDSDVKPQGARDVGKREDDLGDQNELDDSDDRITQRAPSRGSEPRQN